MDVDGKGMGRGDVRWTVRSRFENISVAGRDFEVLGMHLGS
jgi:hypothetical protein